MGIFDLDKKNPEISVRKKWILQFYIFTQVRKQK